MRNQLVLDLHLHSKFSQAVSSSMTVSNLYLWGKMKGVDILSVSDVTHPTWIREIESELIEQQEGIYTLKDKNIIENEYPQYFRNKSLSPSFILTTELSLIYSEFGRGRRVHVIVCFPDLKAVRKVTKEFLSRGFNLSSDGRPILGISLRNLCELLFSVNPNIVIIPAHAWTPWFGVYGSKSGYDSLEEAFGEFAPLIFAIESGLSSDPLMNWQIEELSTRTVVSFSDAHSLPKVAREATVLRGKAEGESIKKEDITYENIMSGLNVGKNGIFELGYTIEFYPGEGKYHLTGHRKCGVSLTPDQTRKSGTVCPVCGGELTVGVLHRIEELKHDSGVVGEKYQDEHGVVWQKEDGRCEFVNLVPLLEIISETIQVGINSKKVNGIYSHMIALLGPELSILLESPINSIARVSGERLALAVSRVRSREIVIQPGFDGEYGKVAIWDENDRTANEQLKMI